MTRSLFLVAALVAAPAAVAQQHGEHSQVDHGQMDHSQMQGMDHAGMDHDALMALHMRMMADPEIHAAMRADAEMRALMADVMPDMDHGAMGHEGVDHEGMSHGQMNPESMMTQMRERMGAMTEAEDAAFIARFESVHRRLLATPPVHTRAMADPELRRMMEAMPGGMPGMDGMDHSGMDRGQINHSQMRGMDHGAMDHSGADHAAGVALQRRNAGATLGDERPATPTVGQAEFDASETADRFHAALAAGDRQSVESLLTPDAVVLEGGRAEARNEYLGGHFARDVAFLADAQPEPIFRRTTVAGDAAWVASTQRIGDATMAELLVMERTDGGWRVSAVHWSSAR
ncbi:MAG: nuclear transport factor 2 family protein [Bacteroidota bacterium]